MINIFIIEDSVDDFNFIKNLLSLNGYNTNSFDSKFRAYVEKCFNVKDLNSKKINEAKKYIEDSINTFLEKHEKIDMFLIDFELFPELIESTNFIEFNNLFLKNNIYQDIERLVISIDVKDYHNELTRDKIFWIKKIDEWKSNNRKGTEWKNMFIEIIENRLNFKDKLESKLNLLENELNNHRVQLNDKVNKDDFNNKVIEILDLIKLLHDEINNSEVDSKEVIKNSNTFKNFIDTASKLKNTIELPATISKFILQILNLPSE
jgi:hypothetical protein